MIMIIVNKTDRGLNMGIQDSARDAVSGIRNPARCFGGSVTLGVSGLEGAIQGMMRHHQTNAAALGATMQSEIAHGQAR